MNSYPNAQHCVRADRREETVDIYYLTELLFYFLTVPVCALQERAESPPVQWIDHGYGARWGRGIITTLTR